jgi:diguanylate cyclase (GGDEF)-like protein
VDRPVLFNNIYIVINGTEVRITVSVGITSIMLETLDETLKVADECLYKAKHQGRNKTFSG